MNFILIITFFFIILLTSFIFLLLSLRKRNLQLSTDDNIKIKTYETSSPEAVGSFYNTYTDDFLKVYGNVIQAYRTINTDDLLEYESNSMGLKKGLHLLDAGCGVGGPAMYFAKKYNLKVDGITISTDQVKKAEVNIVSGGLTDQVSIQHGDYHKLEDIVAKNSYDVVYFLESLGHSNNHPLALESAFKILKPGGKLYVKDLFQKIPAIESHKVLIDQEVKKINDAYHYNIMRLESILTSLRQIGYIISFVKTIDIPLDKFENLTISNDFQELTGIGKIDNWDSYIFPVDFFEILCLKPEYDLEKGNKRYFLQNLYQMQVNNWKKSQL